MVPLSGRAAPNYEPTVDEIQEFIHSFDDVEAGAHGTMTIIPTMERYIWSIPVFWGHRSIGEDGFVTLSWVLPPLCDHCGNL